ncbi:glycosyltransferase [Umezawaea endophytica]|uniref:Glucosyl-3-phosphoglycerate synthase n=1 Tax=Umezawaea endophytica TaxID=1654476 RepID=A0A9X3AFQ5_9PSEU|nr:glycosyltransferase [Umezawaea endophytica]MCS7479027.1 glycosyltransferase [Umezawaea endophytica]
MTRRVVDPVLGIDLVAERTLDRRNATVSVVVPAHDERATVASVVADARKGLADLGVEGEVVVSASGCHDDTAEVAAAAGARVVEAPVGKGNAITAGVAASTGDVVCLVDGDLSYFGDRPLVALLVEPILSGVADATVSDLHWRPIYPQLWLNGFFLPLAGLLYPDLVVRVGSTPWSGQRAAVRELWPAELPADFTADLALLLHWNAHAQCLRPVLADDWTNPQRPKPDLVATEFRFLVSHAVADGRITEDLVPVLDEWFEGAHDRMADYRHGHHEPRRFERWLLLDSLRELRSGLSGA